MTLSNRRMMVTGSAGFIGSHLTERLLANDTHVTDVDDLSNGNSGRILDAADFVVPPNAR